MLEPRGDAHLALEAAPRVAGVDEDLLERDVAAEPEVACDRDAAHAAARDLVRDGVVRGIDDRQVRVVGWRQRLWGSRCADLHRLGRGVAARGDGIPDLARITHRASLRDDRYFMTTFACATDTPLSVSSFTT